MRGIAWAVSMAFSIGLFSFARAEVPIKLVYANNMPWLALFDVEKKSYALGCWGIAEQWNGVPSQLLTIQNYASVQATYPVEGDIFCDGRTLKFNGAAGPGGIVVTNRDGTQHVHYVDSAGFQAPIPGPVPTFTAADLARYPRLEDFNKKMLAISYSMTCQVGMGEAYLVDSDVVGSSCHCGCETGKRISRWNDFVGSCPLALGCGGP